MKKYLTVYAKKYLPIGIALLIVIACFATLAVYDRSFAEYVIVSYTDSTYGFDLTVSSTGKVVSIEPANKESYDILESVASIKGEKVEKAVLRLSELTASKETAFISAVASDESEIELSVLREFAAKAASEIEISHMTAYAYYADSDVQRVSTFETCLGKIAYSTYFIKLCEETLGLPYLDSYLVSPADVDMLAYYIDYLIDNVIVRFPEAELCADVSDAKPDFEFISYAEALEIVVNLSDGWYGEPINNFTYCGISFSKGTLDYCFSTESQGYLSYSYVNMIDGMAYYDGNVE